LAFEEVTEVKNWRDSRHHSVTKGWFKPDFRIDGVTKADLIPNRPSEKTWTLLKGNLNLLSLKP
jgi:hypothetical protein